jgi:predicted nucleic acid-binding protein
LPYLADTNVAARWMQPNDPRYGICRAAVRTLRHGGEGIYVAPQIVIEYWALATRPIAVNGLGLTIAQVAPRVRLLLRTFPLLAETDAIFPFWRELVETHAIVGRQVYDARLVALMLAHGITHLLTLNPSHFQRFQGITVVEPQNVS